MATITLGNGNGQPLSGYTTIQAAIDATQPGGTIIVPAGVYNEEITIGKPLTLLGAGAFRDPVEGGRPGGESVIESDYPVTIMANGVTVNGFEIRNFRVGITVPKEAFVAPAFLIQNSTVTYNWIHGDVAYLGFTAAPGILRNLSITNNIIHVNNAVGIFALAAIRLARGATDNALYENIDISQNDIKNAKDQSGILAYTEPDAYLINGMVIRCNRFRNTKGGTNINVGNICNGQFIDNLVEDCRVLLGMQFGSVIGNTFTSGGNLALLGKDNSPLRPSCHTAVTNNNFTDEETGNGLQIRAGALAYTIPVHNNAFRYSGIAPAPPPDYSTGYLIRNEGLGTLDATYNWWGSAEGPSGNTGGVTGSVTTSPWIKLYTDDPTKLTPPTCWPLSTVMAVQPGFWPDYPTGVSYIGKTCFNIGECVVLLARVSYSGGDGSGYVVGFDFSVLSLISQTLAGGMAYVCLGTQIPAGAYDLTVRLGPYSSETVKIKVGGCGPDGT